MELSNTFKNAIRDHSDFLVQILDSIEHPLIVINADNMKVAMTNSAIKAGSLANEPTCYQLLHKYDKPCGDDNFPCVVKEVARTKKGMQIEFKKLDSCGKTYIYEKNAFPIFAISGDISYVVVYLIDISERKDIEEKLKSAEHYTRGLIESSLDMIIAVDKDRNIVEFNAAAEKTFGYSKDEVLGKHVSMLYAYPEEEGKSVAEHMAIGKFSGEVLNRRKNGEIFPSSLSSAYFNDSSGKFIGYMGVSRDITIQKQVETALRKSRESLAQAQEIARLGNWDWDFAQDKLYWSDEIYRIFGFEPQEFAPDFESFFGYVHPDDREWVRNSVMEARLEKLPLDITNRIILPDGSERFVREQAGIIFDEIGNPIRMVGTVQDVTEQTLAEKKLRAAKESAENATLLKDKFVSLVSHDLRGPIGTMLGYLKIIMDESVKPLDEGAKLILKSAIDSGKKMNVLIDELLTVSKLKTGSIMPKNSFIDIQNLVSSVLVSQMLPAENKKISMRNDISPNTRIYADRTLLHEVLVNLISNAIKFCKEGDIIRVFTPDREPSTIAVQDSGCGIEKDRFESIFRYEETTSTLGTAGEQGSGLGLPLCRDIVRALGGEITVESELKKSTTFLIKLPFARPLVMLVDNEKTERDLFKEYLKKMDVCFVEAENGRKAMELLEEIKPHLIISNLNMPVMNGFEFIKRLKSENNHASIPVLMITSDTNIETRRKALDMGVDDFITKNAETSDFISHVKQFIG